MSEKRVFEGEFEGLLGVRGRIVLSTYMVEGLKGPIRVTIEPLPVAPMSIGTIRYDPNAKPTPKKPLEPIIHPKYGLLVCEYDYTKPWTWFIAKDYLLEIGDDWIKVYHEAWKPAPGEDDSNGGKDDEYKRRLAQFEEDYKRPRPDIAKAIQDEFRKRFNGGGA